MTKKLDRNELLDLARSPRATGSCEDCAPLRCSGWTSVPGYFDISTLAVLGTLRIEDAQESWDEHHPDGTNFWSDNAPIAVQYYPYNRSDVRECSSCKRKFLHYTEYGGYYLDERVRELNATLIV